MPPLARVPSNWPLPDDAARQRLRGAGGAVRALGPYDGDGADGDANRAQTERCWATFIHLQGDLVEIHADDDVSYAGFIETADGARRSLNAATMIAILEAIHTGGFPVYRK